MVSVLVPARDEEDAIGAALGSLLAQDWPADRMEILVVDGRSADGTREAAQRAGGARIRIVDNPARALPAALNRGVAEAAGEIVVRADAHTTYAADYVRRSVEALERTGADVAGGAMTPAAGGHGLARAVAAAISSPFGAGGAAFRRSTGASGPVDAVYLGACRREAFARFGGFDEDLVRNQDDEWAARVLARGGVIWLDPAIRSSYRPRRTVRAAFIQFLGYGLYKPAALAKTHGGFRWRHLAPSAWVLGMAGLGTWAVVDPAAAPVLWGAVGLYAAAAVAAAGAAGCPSAAVVFPMMHAGYGLGFLGGLLGLEKVHRAHATAVGFAS